MKTTLYGNYYFTTVSFHIDSIQAWSPWLKSDIELLESVLKQVLKMTSGLHNTTYLDHLKEVNLTTLEER